MSISRIRGEQIKSQVIKNEHVAADAAIDESKLNINWTGRHHEALATKKLIDFVQVNGSAVGGLSVFDITTIIGGTTPRGLSADNVEGVIIDAPKNKAIVRDGITGDPILDAAGKEVYGRVVFVPGVNPAPDKFELHFYTTDGASAEVVYAMPANKTVDWQYAQRFNLDTVTELFAANEKFVQGAADATAHLNIDQLAKDLYGATYALDRDGNANLATSLADQIANETTARTNADTAIRSDLSSTAAGKGAGLLGVDAAKGLTGANVEAVLENLNTRLTTTETGGGAEVSNTHTRDAATANGYFALTTFGSLEARLVDIENVSDAEIKKALDDRLLRTKELESAGVLNGGVVAAAAAPNMSVDVAAGVIYGADGKRFSFAGVNKVIAAADAANPRIDVVYVDNTGNVQVLSGTAAATPAVPVVPAGGIKLAEVTVPAAAASVVTGNVADKRILVATGTEIQTARGTNASLGARLDRALNASGTLKEGTKIHKHWKARFQAVGGEKVVLLSSFNVANLPNFQVGDNSLDVYVNGILQNVGLHYTEAVDGTSIDFGADGTALVAGDLITIKYLINNAE